MKKIALYFGTFAVILLLFVTTLTLSKGQSTVYAQSSACPAGCENLPRGSSEYIPPSAQITAPSTINSGASDAIHYSATYGGTWSNPPLVGNPYFTQDPTLACSIDLTPGQNISIESNVPSAPGQTHYSSLAIPSGTISAGPIVDISATNPGYIDAHISCSGSQSSPLSVGADALTNVLPQGQTTTNPPTQYPVQDCSTVTQSGGTASSPTNNLSGWAWSSNIGWLSFNSADTGAGGGPYSVQVSTSTGTMSGYAWSPNIGWVSFSDVSGCPSGGSCTPAVNFSTGAVTGWARVFSEIGRNDGWDGWIELSGTNHASPDTTGNSGVTYDNTTGNFTGYAWGGNVMGWLDFSPTAGQTGGTSGTSNVSYTGCGGPVNTSPNLVLSANSGDGSITGNSSTKLPVSIYGGSASVDLNWNISNYTSCSYSGADWSKVSPSPTTITSNANGSGNLMYYASDYDSNDPNDLQGGNDHTFTITCDVPNVQPIRPFSQAVTITLTDLPNNQQPVTMCTQPSNSIVCGNSDMNPQSKLTVYTSSTTPACLSSQAPSCNVYCKPGFKAQGNSCVKSTLQEI